MSNSYGFKEEVANAISHGVGLILGIVGLVLLLVKAVDQQADALTITSMSIYGGSMIALFWLLRCTTLSLISVQSVG